jgi:hypothetical protein
MRLLTDHPLILALVAFPTLCLCAYAGYRKVRVRGHASAELRADFGLVLAATLTLLGLLIGFTFSMAASRYDQRKNYEEAEANAIGTEYVRADFLPEADAAQVRKLLREYLGQRIAFYTVRDRSQEREIVARTEELQTSLWDTVVHAAKTQPTPVMTLAVAGMNDVLNSQGYSQAAWLNRIPTSAWLLMALVAMLCNLMVGYTQQSGESRRRFLAILPLVVSVAFFLIADIDSPRGGIVRVAPQNLLLLSASLK